MKDLDRAKNLLEEMNHSLVIVSNAETIFETDEHGIAGFLTAIEKLGPLIIGAAIADKVIGRAAALLCVYSKVSSVYACILSSGGEQVLTENTIYYERKRQVESILGNDGKSTCPFEAATLSIQYPDEAYAVLKAVQGSLNVRRRIISNANTLYQRKRHKGSTHE